MMDAQTCVITTAAEWTPLPGEAREDMYPELWSGRVRSLYAMLRFYAETFVESMELLARLRAHIYDYAGDKHLPPARTESLNEDLDKFLSQLEYMQLPVSNDAVQLLRHRLNDGATFSELRSLLDHVSHTIQSELRSNHFLQIPVGLARYYQEGNPLFGTAVAEKFPSVSYDASEAGKCLAVGRNTACVFHLMRVLEIGLTALGKVFGVSLAHTNWQPAIEQIEKKIREMGADPHKAPNWKEEQEFYAQAASHFMVFKDAWRNYTAHARGKYDEQEAEMILRNVQAFMQKLATRLSE